MGKCDGYLMLSDMDGTLLTPEGTVSERNRTAIDAFVAEGGRFSVATGRTRHTAWSRIGDLAINSPGIILNGGAVCDFSTNTMLYERCFQLNEIGACVSEMLKQFPDAGVIAFEAHRNAILAGCEWVDMEPEEERAWYSRVGMADLGVRIYKVIFIASVECVAIMREWVSGQPEAAILDMVLASENCLELLPKGVSKGSALNWLHTYLGISAERTIAIGDYENDAEMLRVAGIAAAPENAHPDILALADYVVAHHKNDAVADLLDKLFGIS